MSSPWWLALALLALPLWWHRRRRERAGAGLLASARFLPPGAPRRLRVWRWSEPLLLLLRCLLLVCVVAWLADPTLAWRGDTVLLARAGDAAWVSRQVAAAGFGAARRLEVPSDDPIGWLQRHEGQWRADARLLLIGNVPMPAALPRFRHRVVLRSADAAAAPPRARRIAIVGAHGERWRAMFAALAEARHDLVGATPQADTDLLIWDTPQAPPPTLRAPLWWVADTTAFPALASAPRVDGMRYADSAHGRLWSVSAPDDAEAARRLLERWQRLHEAPAPYPTPSQAFDASAGAQQDDAAGNLRDLLAVALTALFVLERLLSHAGHVNHERHAASR